MEKKTYFTIPVTRLFDCGLINLIVQAKIVLCLSLCRITIITDLERLYYCSVCRHTETYNSLIC